MRNNKPRQRGPLSLFHEEFALQPPSIRAFALIGLICCSAAVPKIGNGEQPPVARPVTGTVDNIPNPYPHEPDNSVVVIRMPTELADGHSDASGAIQQAIDRAAARGGTVVFPPGRFFIGALLTLRSNVTLLGARPDQTFVEDRDPTMPPVERPAAKDVGGATTLIQADNLGTMIAARPHGDEACRNVALLGLNFIVEGSENNKNQQFIDFTQCRDVYVGHCSFDSSSKAGKFGMFHQVDFTQCDGTTCVHNRFHNSLAGTGVNGAKWLPELGKRGYFAMNLVTEYADTGIGLWTGANDCLVERNVLRGLSSGNDPYAVGVDCDGPHHCTIRRNSIVNGQIGVRLFDCHDGEYPISAVTVAENSIGGQRNNPNGNPAACIKVVHQINPAIKLYNMDFDIRDNRFEIVTRGIMMWSYAPRGGPHWCSPGLRGNQFLNEPSDRRLVITVGGYRGDGQYIFQRSRNDFADSATKQDAAPFASQLAQLSEGNPLIRVDDESNPKN
jgi:hypothetical protein